LLSGAVFPIFWQSVDKFLLSFLSNENVERICATKVQSDEPVQLADRTGSSDNISCAYFDAIRVYPPKWNAPQSAPMIC
jgi:hypothetical protein